MAHWETATTRLRRLRPVFRRTGATGNLGPRTANADTNVGTARLETRATSGSTFTVSRLWQKVPRACSVESNKGDSGSRYSCGFGPDGPAQGLALRRYECGRLAGSNYPSDGGNVYLDEEMALAGRPRQAGLLVPPRHVSRRIAAEVMCRVQCEKDVVFGAVRIYTAAVTGPKW